MSKKQRRIRYGLSKPALLIGLVLSIAVHVVLLRPPSSSSATPGAAPTVVTLQTIRETAEPEASEPAEPVEVVEAEPVPEPIVEEPKPEEPTPERREEVARAEPEQPAEPEPVVEPEPVFEVAESTPEPEPELQPEPVREPRPEVVDATPREPAGRGPVWQDQTASGFQNLVLPEPMPRTERRETAEPREVESSELSPPERAQPSGRPEGEDERTVRGAADGIHLPDLDVQWGSAASARELMAGDGLQLVVYHVGSRQPRDRVVVRGATYGRASLPVNIRDYDYVIRRVGREAAFASQRRALQLGEDEELAVAVHRRVLASIRMQTQAEASRRGVDLEEVRVLEGVFGLGRDGRIFWRTLSSR